MVRKLTPRPRLSSEASRHFIDGASTPPVPGGEYPGPLLKGESSEEHFEVHGAAGTDNNSSISRFVERCRRPGDLRACIRGQDHLAAARRISGVGVRRKFTGA